MRWMNWELRLSLVLIDEGVLVSSSSGSSALEYCSF